MEDMTGMGFDPNNYSPIPPVGNAPPKQGAALQHLHLNQLEKLT